MAKGYKAATQIKHGMGKGNVKVFEIGDAVTGLNETTMKSLWDAGALEEVEVTDPAPAEESKATEPLKTEEQKVEDKKAEEVKKESAPSTAAKSTTTK